MNGKRVRDARGEARQTLGFYEQGVRAGVLRTPFGSVLSLGELGRDLVRAGCVVRRTFGTRYDSILGRRHSRGRLGVNRGCGLRRAGRWATECRILMVESAHVIPRF